MKRAYTIIDGFLPAIGTLALAVAYWRFDHMWTSGFSAALSLAFFLHELSKRLP